MNNIEGLTFNQTVYQKFKQTKMFEQVYYMKITYFANIIHNICTYAFGHL